MGLPPAWASGAMPCLMPGFLTAVASLVAQAAGRPGLQQLRHVGSGLENTGSTAVRGLAARGMRDLPGAGTKPVSPATAGGPSTTEPPGKPRPCFLWIHSNDDPNITDLAKPHFLLAIF